MSSSMKTPHTVCYMYLTVLVLLDKVDALICGYENFNDTKKEEEGSFGNISHTINVTDTLDVTVLFEMCRNNSLTSGCKFIWKSQSKEMTARNQSAGDAMVCFWKHRNHSQSMFTFELHASYLVHRSVSMSKLSIVEGDSGSNLVTTIRLETMYPPKITNLTVDEQEISGYHLIEDDEEVRVTCAVDEGNPPAVFRLLDKARKQLLLGQSRLTYSLSAQCEDDWPRISCEGNSSKQNRSVSFLVRCPVQFVDNFKVVSRLSSGIITFRVKTHTTEVKECHLTPISAHDNSPRSVNCTLKGSPPDIELSLHVGDGKSIAQGTWVLTVRNEKGSTNTTVVITPILCVVDVVAAQVHKA